MHTFIYTCIIITLYEYLRLFIPINLSMIANRRYRETSVNKYEKNGLIGIHMDRVNISGFIRKLDIANCSKQTGNKNNILNKQTNYI